MQQVPFSRYLARYRRFCGRGFSRLKQLEGSKAAEIARIHAWQHARIDTSESRAARRPCHGVPRHNGFHGAQTERAPGPVARVQQLRGEFHAGGDGRRLLQMVIMLIVWSFLLSFLSRSYESRGRRFAAARNRARLLFL